MGKRWGNNYFELGFFFLNPSKKFCKEINVLRIYMFRTLEETTRLEAFLFQIIKHITLTTQN